MSVQGLGCAMISFHEDIDTDMGPSIYCVFKVLVRWKVRHGRAIPPNHTPKPYRRIIPPHHTPTIPRLLLLLLLLLPYPIHTRCRKPPVGPGWPVKPRLYQGPIPGRCAGYVRTIPPNHTGRKPAGLKGTDLTEIAIWVFPKIGVPPNQPFL